MKKLILAMAAVVMTAGFAANAANDEKKCDKKAGEKCEQVDQCKQQNACPLAEFKDLNLTDQQKAQLEALKAEQRAAREQAKKDAKDAKQAKAENRRECRQQYLAKVKEILTPEQYTRYMEQQLVQGRKAKAHRPEGMKGRKGGEKAMRHAGKAMHADKAQCADKAAK